MSLDTERCQEDRTGLLRSEFMCFGSLNLFGVNLHCVAPSEAVGSIRAGKDVSWVAPTGFFGKFHHACAVKVQGRPCGQRHGAHAHGNKT